MKSDIKILNQELKGEMRMEDKLAENLTENERLLEQYNFFRRYYGRVFEESELNLDFLEKLIRYQCTFSIKTKKMSKTVAELEAMIEKCGYKCRVYTENRSFALASVAIPGFGLLTGTAVAIGIVAHNLATFFPDFEIGKNFFEGKVNVTYKK